MQFSSFADFINMGGYGFYVWLSYGVALALLVGLVMTSISGRKRVITEIAMRLKREDKLRQARAKNKQTTSQSSPQTAQQAESSENKVLS